MISFYQYKMIPQGQLTDPHPHTDQNPHTHPHAHAHPHPPAGSPNPMTYTPLDDRINLFPNKMLIRTPSNLCLSCCDTPSEFKPWPCVHSSELFDILLQSKKHTLGDFIKQSIKLGRKNKKNIKMSWPDFCVAAAREYSIVYPYDVQRPDVWRDQMFVLSLIASMV